STEFWYSPKVLPYRGFIPISKLPEERRVIHDTNMYLNRANRDWELALTTSSESASNNNAVNEPAVQRSAVINNQVSMEPTLIITARHLPKVVKHIRGKCGFSRHLSRISFLVGYNLLA
ncbi:unnamed protein product, partial [Allacma fusca]